MPPPIDLKEISMCNNIYLEMPPPIDLKARPIVAGPISATSRLSKIIDKLLSPLVQNLKSYIKDDLDLIRKLPSNIGYECDLYSFDITSLYTSIGHDLGIKAVRYWIEKYREQVPKRFTNEFIEEVISSPRSTLFVKLLRTD